MQDAFHLGGWGMYPTTIAGLVLLFAAVRYARQPDLIRREVVRRLAMLTFLVSCLGFVTGVIKSFVAAGADNMSPDLGRMVVGGVGESLNNVGLGLVLLIVASIATSIGAARAKASPRTLGAELTDPLA